MREYHYWITARDETGKPYLIYGSPAKLGESAARQKAMEMLPFTNWTLKRLPTTDIGKASALIRGVRLEKTHNLKESSRRQGHNKALERYKQRRKEHQQASRGW